MEFIETPLFSRIVQNYFSDDEYTALQLALVMSPDAGPVIRGSGGIRKLRWGATGRGKRGGYRIIYYWKNRAGEIWLLTMYAKNEKEDLSHTMLRKLKEEIE